MLSCKTDLNAEVVCVLANASASSGAPSVVTAGAALDGAKVDGATIDLLGKTNGGSGVLVVTGLAALAATKTLTVAAELQESSDGSSWDTAEVVYAATLVATGPAGGGNVSFVKASGILLKSRKRYIRFNITPELNATGTDTAEFTACFVIGGDDVLPAAA